MHACVHACMYGLDWGDYMFDIFFFMGEFFLWSKCASCVGRVRKGRRYGMCIEVFFHLIVWNTWNLGMYFCFEKRRRKHQSIVIIWLRKGRSFGFYSIHSRAKMSDV
jgi:hypothetical protein